MDYKRMDMEAEELLIKYNVYEYPVPIITLANKLGLEVCSKKMVQGVSGYILVNEEDSLNPIRKIFVNEDDYVVRKRFTIAHEIGHYILHKQDQKVYAHRDLDVGDNNTREIEANAFAIGLLAPRGLALKFINEQKQKYGLSLAKENLAIFFAKEFLISVSSAGYRIQNLLRG